MMGPASMLCCCKVGAMFGGAFRTAGGDVVGLNLLRFDGTEFAPFESSVPGGGDPIGFGKSTAINTMAVFDDNLFIGGPPGTLLDPDAGGDSLLGNTVPLAVAGVARHDGNDWHDSGIDRPVLTLAEHDGQLVAGALQGGSAGDLLWTLASAASSWSAHPGAGDINAVDLDGVRAMASFDGDLYIGGRITIDGEGISSIIARWDTTASEWVIPDGGLSRIGTNTRFVEAMVVFDAADDLGEALYVAGQFTHFGSPDDVDDWSSNSPRWSRGVARWGMARFDAGSITVVNGVVTLAGAAGGWPYWAEDGEIVIGEDVYAVDTLDSDTQLTLTDTSVNESETAYELLSTRHVWSATRDWPTSANGRPGALAVHDGKLYAATRQIQPGALRVLDEDSRWVNVATFESPYVTGPQNTDASQMSLRSTSSGLYIGGDFVSASTSAGSVQSPGLVRLSGENMQTLTAAGGGIIGRVSRSAFDIFPRTVRAMIEYDDSLIIGGHEITGAINDGPTVSESDGVAMLRAGRWNRVGLGVEAVPLVRDLTRRSGVYAAGPFELASRYNGPGVVHDSFGIARWPGGLEWQPPAGTSDGIPGGTIRAVQAFDDRVWIGGDDLFGLGQQLRWNDGTTYGTPPQPSGEVYALIVYDGRLIAAGAGFIERLNEAGDAWETIPADSSDGGISITGGDEIVYGLHVHAGSLYAVGSFGSASALQYSIGTTSHDGNGTVTLTGGVFPQWFTSATIEGEPVISRDSDTQLTISDSALAWSNQPTSLVMRAYAIARWTGVHWEPVGNHQFFPARPHYLVNPSSTVAASILTAAHYDGDLYIGGEFTNLSTSTSLTGGFNHRLVARLNASTGEWLAVDGGLRECAPDDVIQPWTGAYNVDLFPRVNTLAVADGVLLAGGSFTEHANGESVQRVRRAAAFDGVGWQPIAGGMAGVEVLAILV
jgi:hypothetical protein